MKFRFACTYITPSKCNFDLNLLKTDIPIDFYKEALKAWQKINNRTPRTKEQVLNEIVWNNRFIKMEGYSVYYKKWHEAGVTKVEDIFLGNTFLPFNDFCNKYKIKTNFLKYYGLCHAVPQERVDILKGKAVVPVEKSADQDKILLDQIYCKLATKYLVKNKFVAPTAERRMRNANLDEVTIQRIYSLPFKVTKDTRLSIFQFKIVHHILPTNATLHRDSLRENDKCHLCKERETLTHLFVTCPIVQIFWSCFVNWWNTKNQEEINLDENDIIYGVTTNFPLRLV